MNRTEIDFLTTTPYLPFGAKLYHIPILLSNTQSSFAQKLECSYLVYKSTTGNQKLSHTHSVAREKSSNEVNCCQG